MHIETNPIMVYRQEQHIVFINVNMLYNAKKYMKEAQLMPMVRRTNGHLTPDLALGSRRGGVPHPSPSNI